MSIVDDSDVPGVFSQIQVQDNGTLFENQTITLSSLTMGSQNLVWCVGRNYIGQYNYQPGLQAARASPARRRSIRSRHCCVSTPRLAVGTESIKYRPYAAC